MLGTGALSAPPATTVTFDLLNRSCSGSPRGGVHYEAVAVKPGLDAEVPTALGLTCASPCATR